MECPSCHATISGSLTRCPACLVELLEPIKTAVHDKEFELLDGKWALEMKLGQGGMGTVYLARDLELHRRVAIKMMSRAYADNAELVARFEREAQMMARLDHPNVVPVYAVGRRERSPFIVMKYLEGVSLAEYLAQKGRLPLGEVLSICQQTCEGLQFIHDQGVVHRDIKPANLFIGPTGHVTLLDLGVARDPLNAVTLSGVIVGTPRYMAPEQVLGKRVDHRADLYALGAVLFEMLTGKPVFGRGNDYSIMKAHVDEQPPALGTSAQLTAVLFRALAKQPGERFQSAEELLHALTRAAGPGVTAQRARPAGKGDAFRRATLPRTERKEAPRETPPAPPSTPLLFPTVPAAQRSTPLVFPAVRPLAVEDRPLPSEPPQRSAPPRRWKWPSVAVLAVAAVVATAVFQPWRTNDAPRETARDQRAPTAQGRLPPVASVPAPQPEKPPEVAPDPPPAPLPGSGAKVLSRPVSGEPEAAAGPPRRASPRGVPVLAPAQLRLMVTVNGRPSWAFVDLDGLRQGSTPMTVEVEPGTHRLVFMRQGFEKVTREVTVKSGETRKVSVDLRATRN